MRNEYKTSDIYEIIHGLYIYRAKVIVWGKTKARRFDIFIGLAPREHDPKLSSYKGYAFACDQAERIARRKFHMKPKESQCTKVYWYWKE